MNPNEQINSVAEKVNHLMQRYRQLQQDANALQQKNDYLQTELQRKTETLNGLEEKVSAMQFGGNIDKDAEWKNNLKNRLNTYIKEIDKCIAQLEV